MGLYQEKFNKQSNIIPKETRKRRTNKSQQVVGNK